MKIEENKQILHEIVFSFLKRKSPTTIRWLPTLDELEVFSEYLKFLYALCEHKIYPTEQQIELILTENKLTVFDLLFRKEYGICAQLPKFELQQQTMDEIAEILTRQLRQAQMEKAEIRFFIASKQKSYELSTDEQEVL
jgi:hypothetical protein